MIAPPDGLVRLVEPWSQFYGDSAIAPTIVVFGHIAATVSDVGGTMCHAAILCREYRIPAVLGTGHGTRHIRTGDVLRVDGSAGVVTILSRDPGT